MRADDEQYECSTLADNETDADLEAEKDWSVHGPTLYVPPDGGTAYDVVEAEARRDFYDRSGVHWRRAVDGVTGEPPEPADYRDL